MPCFLWNNASCCIPCLNLLPPKAYRTKNQDMSQIKITIPEPCHENWNNMLPNEQGRHCKVCDKTVTDFTQQSPEQIKAFMDQHASQKICGRFRASDVETVVITPPPVKLSWFGSRWVAVLAAVSFLFFGKKTQAQNQFNFSAGKNTGYKKTSAKKTATVIHGWIRNDEQKGLAKVEVRVFSGGKEIAFSRSFSNGSYFISVAENTIWDFKVTLEYNSVDYVTQVLEDVPVYKDRLQLDMQLESPGKMPQPVQVYALGGIGEYHVQEPAKTMEYATLIEERPMIMGGPMSVVYVHNNEITPTEEIADTATVAVTDVAAFNIKTWPNPGNGMFNLSLENSHAATLQVYDLNGRLIMHKEMPNTTEQIDLTTQTNGTYLVVVTDRLTGHKKQSKIIKTN